MNQYNQRKEPTFGEPFQPKSDKVETENIENVVQNANSTATNSPTKLAFSLSTKTSPGHTFTPVMKRTGDSAKNLSTLEEKNLIEKAEQTMQNQNTQHNSPEVTTPKAPNGGFTFAPVQENTDAVEQPKSVEPTPVEGEKAEEKPVVNPIERVIPTAAPAAKAVADKVPSKYRRLLIVLLLLLALLLAFFLLKPKTPETVENLQQGSSLPIEFRPVDEEEAKRAEAQAKALQEAQAQQAQQQAEQTAQTAQAEQPVQPTMNSNENATASAPQTTETTPVQPAPEQQPAVAVKPVQVAAQPAVQAKAEPKVAATKPVVQEPAKKPATSGSVIYQPETANKSPAKPATPAAQPKVESKPQVKAEAAKPVATQTAQPKPAPVVTAEPAVASVSSKTMTVPKGVSLMQVFRDHNLNISDVNAMSKVNNIVSNLKVGEKITVRLDKDNRVTEMSIGSGGKFIRQANGTYIYK